MADFKDIEDAKRELVLADLHLAILFAPVDGTEPITTLEDVTTGDLLIPAEYTSAGLIEKGAGVDITNDTESSDIEAYGQAEPVRQIINKRTTKFTAQFLETNREVLEKYWGTTFADVVPSAHGGIVIEAPALPKNVYYRCILLGQDDVNGDDLFPYWIMPRVKLSSVDNTSLKDDGAITYTLEFQAFTDDDVDFSVAQGWCGPGWRKLVDKSGFVAPTTAISMTPATASIAVAATQQLTVVGSNGVNRTPDAKFTSSDVTKATVNAAGLVTGVAAGTATVTATYKSFTDTTSVTVSS